MRKKSATTAQATRERLRRLTQIGIALSAERSLDTLLELTLQSARELTDADAGTLYLVRDGALHFSILHNDSMNTRMGGTSGNAVALPPVAMDPSNVSASAALQRKTIVVDDVYDSEEFDFSGPRRYDKQTGYKSKSMLVVPMLTHEGEVIGVLQLINALTPTRKVTTFAEDMVEIIQALASQAAVAITNARLVADIRELFDAMIQVMATAIDEKSPYTGSHIQRVAKLNILIAEAINAKQDGPFAEIQFSPQDMECIRLAGWLHDVGKITTPESVMDKANKLQKITDRIEIVRARFGLMRVLLEAGAMREKLDLHQRDKAHVAAIKFIDDALAEKFKALDDDLAFIELCNSPGEFLADDRIERLKGIAAKTYTNEKGETHPQLTEDELENLSIRRGSLTDAEMNIMRDHVVMTGKMLAKLPFAGHLKEVPRYAVQHHEKLNGKGYPSGLKAEDLPLASRILCVADIYEALSAKDRPYKKPMSEEMILKILGRCAEDGDIDPDVLGLFIEDKLYALFEERFAAEKLKSEDK